MRPTPKTAPMQPTTNSGIFIAAACMSRPNEDAKFTTNAIGEKSSRNTTQERHRGENCCFSMGHRVIMRHRLKKVENKVVM